MIGLRLSEISETEKGNPKPRRGFSPAPLRAQDWCLKDNIGISTESPKETWGFPVFWGETGETWVFCWPRGSRRRKCSWKKARSKACLNFPFAIKPLDNWKKTPPKLRWKKEKICRLENQCSAAILEAPSRWEPGTVVRVVSNLSFWAVSNQLCLEGCCLLFSVCKFQKSPGSYLCSLWEEPWVTFGASNDVSKFRRGLPKRAAEDASSKTIATRHARRQEKWTTNMVHVDQKCKNSSLNYFFFTAKNFGSK